MRAMKIHLKIHFRWRLEVMLSKDLSWEERHRMNASPVACTWTLWSGGEPYCKALQIQAQAGPSLAPWWHTWAPPKALCLVLVLFPHLLSMVLHSGQGYGGCWLLLIISDRLLAPSMFLTLPNPGHSYKLCYFFTSCPSFCSVFSPSPSVSKVLGICLSSTRHGLHGYAMGTEAN